MSVLVLRVPSNALPLLAGWQKGHLAHKKPFRIVGGSKLIGNRLTRVAYTWKMDIKIEVMLGSLPCQTRFRSSPSDDLIDWNSGVFVRPFTKFFFRFRFNLVCG